MSGLAERVTAKVEGVMVGWWLMVAAVWAQEPEADCAEEPAPAQAPVGLPAMPSCKASSAVHPAAPSLLDVDGGPLLACSIDPPTGAAGDGRCAPADGDPDAPTLCVRVTSPMLALAASRGVSLAMTPGGPAPSVGDRWCVRPSAWAVWTEAGLSVRALRPATHASARALLDAQSAASSR